MRSFEDIIFLEAYFVSILSIDTSIQPQTSIVAALANKIVSVFVLELLNFFSIILRLRLKSPLFMQVMAHESSGAQRLVDLILYSFLTNLLGGHCH